MNEQIKTTPLRDRHLAAGARLVPFAGWEMPVQYSGILDEHRAVREKAGVFDISHMGEFFVRGPQSGVFLNRLLTNNVDRLQDGDGQYTLMLNENGGVIDDLIAYRMGSESWLLIVNAAKIDEDEAWIRSQLTDDQVVLENRSEAFAAVAVQGPEADRIHQALFDSPLPARNRLVVHGQGADAVYVGVTGYTGEEGFEIFYPASQAGAMWDRVVEAGAKPCGLGARDTLRLEMCYPLNGSDLDPARSPIEAGLGFFVDLEKGDFVGREVVAEQKASGPAHRLAALQVTGKAPPLRPHYPVWHGETQVGETTSGALSPSLGFGIAMAYLPAELAKIGTELEIGIRDRKYPACVVKKPFYKKN